MLVLFDCLYKTPLYALLNKRYTVAQSVLETLGANTVALGANTVLKRVISYLRMERCSFSSKLLDLVKLVG